MAMVVLGEEPHHWRASAERASQDGFSGKGAGRISVQRQDHWRMDSNIHPQRADGRDGDCRGGPDRILRLNLTRFRLRMEGIRQQLLADEAVVAPFKEGWKTHQELLAGDRVAAAGG